MPPTTTVCAPPWRGSRRSCSPTCGPSTPSDAPALAADARTGRPSAIRAAGLSRGARAGARRRAVSRHRPCARRRPHAAFHAVEHRADRRRLDDVSPVGAPVAAPVAAAHGL
ncbi:hypothetical protein AB5I41_25825 [Sphingomonas sp. MMS24-JH45]